MVLSVQWLQTNLSLLTIHCHLQPNHYTSHSIVVILFSRCSVVPKVTKICLARFFEGPECKIEIFVCLEKLGALLFFWLAQHLVSKSAGQTKARKQVPRLMFAFWNLTRTQLCDPGWSVSTSVNWIYGFHIWQNWYCNRTELKLYLSTNYSFTGVYIYIYVQIFVVVFVYGYSDNAAWTAYIC